MPSSESIEFVNVAGGGLTFLTPGRSTALTEAIDTGQVRAAASSHLASEESVDVLRTDQPFDDIAASLETAGFTRDGDVLASPDADLARERFAAVADAGDGIVLLAGSKGAAVRALAAPVETEAADLLDRVSGVVAGALTPHPPRGCLTALVVGQDAAPAEGELELVIDGEVDADRFALEDDAFSVGGGLEFGEPEASAETLRVRVTYDSGQALSRPINLLTGVSLREVYRC